MSISASIVGGIVSAVAADPRAERITSGEFARANFDGIRIQVGPAGSNTVIDNVSVFA